jgi:hypothetical protein
MTISRTTKLAGLSCALLALGAAGIFCSRADQRASTPLSGRAESSGAGPEVHAAETVTLPDRGFYENLQIAAVEAESYPSLAAMAGAADAVVVGTLSNVRLNRTIVDGVPEFRVHMAAVDVMVSEQVRGDAGRGPLLLEFLVPGREDQVAARIEQQRNNTPVEPVLLFLRKNDAGAYRLVNSHGLWTTVEGRVTSPLVPRPDGAEPRAEHYADELAQVRSLTQLAAQLRR